MRGVALLPPLVFAAPALAEQTASSICVHNEAWFALRWKLHNGANGDETPETAEYPAGQMKCMNASGANITEGDEVVPIVTALWGLTKEASEPVYFNTARNQQVIFTCTGMTLDFSCKPGAPPLPVGGNITKDVFDFALGFMTGFGKQVGFAECIADVGSTYQAIKSIVDFFDSGINHKTPTAIARAFMLIGHMLEDFSAAITSCAKDEQELVKKFTDLSAALSGNVWEIIHVVVDDAMHIFADRNELTDDCKTTTAAWNARDFKASGNAVGDIVGIITSGLDDGTSSTIVV
eukprot:NODE_14225_length_1121_cov_3.495976.p2 GENE.NODE_14225_length_1121_cov_3.495976~~NODE_14225_length_1121_cov_3.495976.p2  ORF type:complete len:292 (+),score=79.41 NODE_14225_length_1121_cov_3.495976:36-911(+)